MPSRSWSRRTKTSCDGVVAVAAVDRQLDRAADLAAEIDEGTGEMLFAEVEPDDEPGVLVDLEQDRGLAAARRAAADLADDAVVEEPGDDVRDGRAGEAGLAGDVRPADRAEVVHGPHDEPLVVHARLLMGRLGRKHHTVGGPSDSGRRSPLRDRLRPVH